MIDTDAMMKIINSGRVRRQTSVAQVRLPDTAIANGTGSA